MRLTSRARARFACILGMLLGSPAVARAAGEAPPEEAPSPPVATPAAAPEGDVEMRKGEARKHFEKGLALFDAEAWDSALAEFLLSRELYPTRAATKNAALCMRRLKRFDEALDMFEQLRAFPDLPVDDQVLADREMAALHALVGAVVLDVGERGARVTVDGRDRGETPMPGRLRVAAGSHVVRVYKTGFEPFERRVEVAGEQSVPVRVELVPIVQSGWLTVEELSGKALDVFVDGVVVGKTPWKGLVPPGEHLVVLRGEGRLGTQPASVPVKLNQVTPLVLLAEELTAGVRVEPTPAGASITVDGVRVGRGVWEGALRAGRHRIEVEAEGFVAATHEVTLAAAQRKTVHASLERIAEAPQPWGGGRPFVEADLGVSVWPTPGGELLAGCTGKCEKSAQPGILVQGRAGLRFPSRFMIGVEAGYGLLRWAVRGRAAAVMPTGLADNPGTANDTLALGGALLGVSPGVRLGQRVPLTFRLGVGAFLGTLSDHRTGQFQSSSPFSYKVDVTETTPLLLAPYVAPEVAVGARVAEGLDFAVSVKALVIAPITPPRWDERAGYVLAMTDGQGRFPPQNLTDKVLFAIAPSIGARYEF